MLKKPYRSKFCNINFWIENDPHPPTPLLRNFSKNSSVLDVSGIPKECFDKFTHKYMQICAQGVATFPILTSLECRNKTIKRHIVRLQTHARKFKLHNFLELIHTFRLSKSYLYDVQTYGRIVFKSDIKIFVFI